MTDDERSQKTRAMWNQWLKVYRRRLWLDVTPPGTDGLLLTEDDLKSANEKRRALMDANNPVYVLRQYMLQSAIEAAEKGDFTDVQRLQELMRNPYTNQEDKYSEYNYTQIAPTWSDDLKVS